MSTRAPDEISELRSLTVGSLRLRVYTVIDTNSSPFESDFGVAKLHYNSSRITASAWNNYIYARRESVMWAGPLRASDYSEKWRDARGRFVGVPESYNNPYAREPLFIEITEPDLTLKQAYQIAEWVDGYLNDNWNYIGVVAELSEWKDYGASVPGHDADCDCCSTGEWVEICQESLFGIEDSDTAYIASTGRDLAREVIATSIALKKAKTQL